jgi:hypothetical protein
MCSGICSASPISLLVRQSAIVFSTSLSAGVSVARVRLGLIGSDIFGPNFVAAWTFDYALPTSQTITAAILVLGMYDVDASANTAPPAGFALNSSVDLTAAINQVFTHHGTGKNAEYDVYTLSLPSSAFATLQTGQATFGLGLDGPGLGVLGLTPFNGAGLDFSTLDVVTTSPAVVPEPSILAVLMASFANLPRSITSPPSTVQDRMVWRWDTTRPVMAASTVSFTTSTATAIRFWMSRTLRGAELASRRLPASTIQVKSPDSMWTR